MIVAGTVTYKMAMAVSASTTKCPEPKWVIAMALGFHWWDVPQLRVFAGVDRIIPVDVYRSWLSAAARSVARRPDQIAGQDRHRTGAFNSAKRWPPEPARWLIFKLRILKRQCPHSNLRNQLKAKFSDLISDPAEFRGEVSSKVLDAERITEVCAFAKKELGF